MCKRSEAPIWVHNKGNEHCIAVIQSADILFTNYKSMVCINIWTTKLVPFCGR